MWAVFKREIANYFVTPIGYIFLAAFYLISAFFWFGSSLIYGMTDTSILFSNLFVVSLFLVPVLTMRLFSEERKQGTDLLLFTTPVSLTAIVVGKFLSAFCAYGAGLSITLVYAAIMAVNGYLVWSVFLCNFFGILLLGGALIAIGLFISSLTESQVAAAVGSFLASLFLLLVDSVAGLIPFAPLTNFIDALSFYNRYQSFTLGVLDVGSVIFFFTVATLFCLLTSLALGRRKS